MGLFEEQQKKGKGRLIKTFLVLMILSSFFMALNELVYLISNKVLFKSLSPAEIFEGIANISSALIVVDFILNLAVIVFAIVIVRGAASLRRYHAGPYRVQRSASLSKQGTLRRRLHPPQHLAAEAAFLGYRGAGVEPEV